MCDRARWYPVPLHAATEMESFRVIPSIERLLQREALRDAMATHGHDSISAAARTAADELRERIADPSADVPAGADAALAWLESRTLALAASRTRASLRRVINATGVIIHTNLGR